jgi:hypothetical protein
MSDIEEYRTTAREQYYDDWLSDNIYSLRQDFVSNDPGYKEFCTYPEADDDLKRREYIELQGLEDDFNTFCRDEFSKEDD